MSDVKRIHLIGICGTAMATLAAMLQARGLDVQGSDRGIYPPMSDFLARERIRVFDGYHPENIPADIDMVVVGNAISRGNPELEHVLDRKIHFVSLPEALRDRFLWTSRSIVIAGTHGKTTTTALTGWLLTSAGRDPSVLVGGIARNFEGSYRLGAGRDFVIEGDEYDSAFFDKTAKFLKYLPDVAVIGNLEYDHADIYPDMESLRTAFKRLLQLVPRRGRILVGADSEKHVESIERILGVDHVKAHDGVRHMNEMLHRRRERLLRNAVSRADDHPGLQGLELRRFDVGVHGDSRVAITIENGRLHRHFLAAHRQCDRYASLATGERGRAYPYLVYPRSSIEQHLNRPGAARLDCAPDRLDPSFKANIRRPSSAPDRHI